MEGTYREHLVLVSSLRGESHETQLGLNRHVDREVLLPRPRAVGEVVGVLVGVGELRIS
jgi:hypothetical protein